MPDTLFFPPSARVLKWLNVEEILVRRSDEGGEE